MKNYLVMTLGTSDIQVNVTKLEENGFQIDGNEIKSIHSSDGFSIQTKPNRDFKDTRLLAESRTDGEKIWGYGWKKIRGILEYPLVLPAIDQFFEENKGRQINTCLLVFTDQTDPHFRKYDTLFTAKILKEVLMDKYDFSEETFIDFPVKEQVTNIDFQYQEFAKKCGSMLNTPFDEVNQVVLFSQGGIDQINQALTLQFIQAYGTKLKLYQKAEKGDPIKLKFPELFLKDLNKQKLVEHLDKYNFGLIDHSLTNDSTIKSLAAYAYNRLELKHKDLGDHFSNFIAKISNTSLSSHRRLIKPPKKYIDPDPELMLFDLYMSAKIAHKQKRYSELLWKLFSVNENILKLRVNELMGCEMDEVYYQGHRVSFENNKLIEIIRNYNPATLEYLESKGFRFENPNRRLYEEILKFEIQLGKSEYQPLIKVAQRLENIVSKRNKLAHSLKSINLQNIENALGISILKLFEEIDQVLDVDGFDIYEEFRKEIYSKL